MNRQVCALLGAVAVSTLALAACAPKAAGSANASASGGPAMPAAAADTSKDIDALKAQMAQYGVDIQSRQLDKVAAYYAPDAVFIGPNYRFNGGGPIRLALEQSMADPAYGVALAPDTITVGSSGDVAYVVGHVALTGLNPATHRVERINQGLVAGEKKDSTGVWRLEAVAVANQP
jgi:ketosteroid isomerase-like protein